MTNTVRLRTCLILAAGLLVAPVLLDAEIIEQILVKVNGEIFTKTDLETRQVQAMRQRGIQLDPKTDPTDAQLRQALNTVTPQVMVEAVTEMLLVQRGKELGYKLGDDQFKQIVDNIRKENKLDTDEKFEAALKQENMTLADLRRQVERSIVVQRVESVEVFGKVAISEDEARRYYDAHLAEFTTPAAVTLREILVAVPADAADPAQDAAARAKADDIHRRAAAGENYMKLAEDSSDAPSKANAGLIGPISLSDLSADLRKVVEPMKNGEISPVIRTPRGYQIFKVETLSASQTTPFEQARESISDRIVTGKRKEEFDKYLTKLRAQAIIEWKNPDIQKAFEEGLAEQAKPAAPAAQ